MAIADGGFPVIYSTLAPAALIAQVLSHYDLPTIRDCQFWHRGLSDVYYVETVQDPYILRVSHCHWRCKSEIDFELSLLDFLRQQGFPIAYPIPSQQGDLAIPLAAPEGERYASVFIYAPGTIALGDLNLSQAAILGKTVAHLHQSGQNFSCSADRAPLDLDYLLDHSWQTISPFLRHRPLDINYIETAIADIKQQLCDFPQEPPFWVVCWGDPHSGNAHFTPDNQPTLFDFDQCGYGWRAFEVSKFRQAALKSGVSRAVRAAFLDGYQQNNPLEAFELAAIPALTQVAQIWVWSISLINAMHHNYCQLDDRYFNLRLEQLKQLRSPDWTQF